MFFLLASGLFLSLSILLTGSLLAWLALRLYVLQVLLSYRQDCIRLMLQLDSSSKNMLSVFLYNEDRQWFAGIRTPRRFVWQQSWILPTGMRRLRMWSRVRSLWKHRQRPAWTKAVQQFLTELNEKLICRRILLNVRMGFSSYPETGYLAAIAYPLNFTLFRCLGVLRPNIIPDFSNRGFAFENQIRFTFRGYQLWRPSYHFLNDPVVRNFLWSRFSSRLGRFTHRRRRERQHSSHSGRGSDHGNSAL